MWYLLSGYDRQRHRSSSTLHSKLHLRDSDRSAPSARRLANAPGWRTLLHLIALLSLAAFVASCATGPRPPLSRLEEAAARIEGGGSDGRALALAAWSEWLVNSDPERLEALALRAASREPADPWAHLALAEGARRRLDARTESEALLTLISQTPSHPLASVAAGRLGSLLGNSVSLDRLLEEEAARLLEGRALDPEAAWRLRELLLRARAREGVEAIAAGARGAGLMTEASVVGPFSPWRHLERERPFAPEEGERIPERYEGQRGAPLDLRPFSMPDGWLSLSSEESDGNVYYALAVATVPASGRYVLRLQAGADTGARVSVDGVRAISREPWGRGQPAEGAVEMELGSGDHLIALRLLRASSGAGASLSLAPADGSTSRVRWRRAQKGDGRGSSPRLLGKARSRSASLVAASLEEEVGILAAYVAAQATAAVDPEGAKELLAAALKVLPRSAPLWIAKAELSRSDRSLPATIAGARAAAEVEVALREDSTNPTALSIAASLLREAGQHEDALESLDRARAGAPTGAVSLAKAMVASARGLEAQALEYAREAFLSRGSCQAGAMVFELSRRAEDVKAQEELARALAACPRGRERLAELLADRGRSEEALELARALYDEAPQSPGAGFRLADLLLRSGAADEAARVLAALERAWPRRAWLPKRRAQLLERAGDLEGADEARRRAILLDGGDLLLQRNVALRRGEDLFDRYNRDGLEVIRDFERGGQAHDTSAVILFDYAAVDVGPDGSMIERIHTVSKILEKSGVDRLGEVHLPGGAEVIHLRTIKGDGRILEPEDIGGKDSISLPNLDVGDYVEVEYLNAVPARGNGIEGWSAAPFYFRIEGLPIVDSLYVVRAPKSLGLELDRHGGSPVGTISEEGDRLVALVHEQDIPAFHQEPSSVRLGEVFPWVQAGGGAGEGTMAMLLGDALAGAADRSFEVATWARAIAARQRKEPADLVRALYDAAMEEIEGDDGPWGASASEVLARKRGSRLVLLKAALDELGIEARFAALRPFDQDPSPMRFPRSGRFGHLALAVRPEPRGGLVWLDPTVRWAPFGEVAPLVRGVPGYLLPLPGEEGPLATSSPTLQDVPQGREIELELTVGGDGALVGSGVERYLGFEAAWARSGLERLDEERRRQVIEAALAKSFRGLILEELVVEGEAAGSRAGGGEPGPAGAVSLHYRFRVPGYAQDLGEGLSALPLEIFPADLGRRFLTRAQRQSPLLLASPERVRSRVELTLPRGASVIGGPEAARELGLFGGYKRVVAIEGCHGAGPCEVTIQEELDLERGRVSPREYQEFAGWALAVDRAQSEELIYSLPVREPVAAEPVDLESGDPGEPTPAAEPEQARELRE